MDSPHLAALAELSRSVLAGVTLPALMRQAAALVASTLSIEYSAIWELDTKHNTLVLRAGVGWLPSAMSRTSLEAASIASSMASETSIIAIDWEHESRPGQHTLLPDHSVASSLWAIIHRQQQPVGVLCADSATRRVFTNDEHYLLRTIANLLALVTERAEASQRLEQQVQQLVDENARLVAAAQNEAILEERQRLARDLHDSVTQALYGVTLHAEAATRLLASGDSATVASYLRELQSTAQEALDEMRLLIFELRPAILEQAGLAAALQARLGAVEGRANLETKLLVDGVNNLPAQVEQALYRIAQEAMNNTLRHAHARRITVHLRHMSSSVSLEVADDGMGFDPGVAAAAGGLGLRGMAERVARLGGTLLVQSAPGSGTRVRVEVEL